MDKTPSSGSFSKISNSLVGTLEFYEEGEIKIFGSEDGNVDEQILDTFRITSDFICYALTRYDWMSEFAIATFPDDIYQPPESSKPKLTLIKGEKEE